MNIHTRFQDLDAKLQNCRVTRVLALAGVIGLFLALLIPAIESKPIMAFCVTSAIACQLPLLLRWHAWQVEREVLAKLVQNEPPQT